MATIDELVGAYIKLRDRKKAMQAKQAEELAPINQQMSKLEVGMLLALSGQNAESVRTPHGTVYKTKRTSSKVDDWNEALSFILKHHLEHMLEKRVAKTAVEEYLEANGELPPGISLSTETSVNVRRK